jgi:glycosyltransferase involved in cell wall biosynthesis
VREPGRPLVSLLMGVHNGGRYLGAAIDSVLGQTLGDLELIVVDDASSDGSGELLAGYSDPRLVVLRNEENIGLTRSLNRALAAARGRYVGRQDADDRSLPRRLEREVAFLEEHPDVGLVGSWARFVDGDGRVVTAGHPPADPDELAAGLLVENRIFHGSILARRELMEELGGYRDAFRYSQDYDLYLRAIDGHRLANVPEELYELRFHTGAITGSKQELQHRYRELARRLAAQRRRGGRDDLDAGVPVEELLEQVALDSDSAEFWRHRAMYRRLMGDLPGYRRALLEALRRNPRDARGYVLLAMSLGGRRFLERSERAWQRLGSGRRESRAG